MSAKALKIRQSDKQAEQRLQEQGLSPLMARLLASRGMSPEAYSTLGLSDLINPNLMLNMDKAAAVLRDHIIYKSKICIAGDYDCDGAGATAVAMRGIKMLHEACGHSPSEQESLLRFVVPDRFKEGYGLSKGLVERAFSQGDVDLFLTVDNGISAHEGIQYAKDLGATVLVTDHHLQGDTLPNADVILNPNQKACTFPSKAIAGVGVMFYLLIATRALMRQSGDFIGSKEADLRSLLPIVSMSTVADVVPMSCANNMRMVDYGLKMIRRGDCQPGIKALFEVAGKSIEQATSSSHGFVLGPRINACGRLETADIGIQLLCTDNMEVARSLASLLDETNKRRRDIEAEMKEEAFQTLLHQGIERGRQEAINKKGMVVVLEEGNHGVIGILASRIKETFYRPVIVLAPDHDKLDEHGRPMFYKGSGRSIAGVHLRDVVDYCQKNLPAGAIPAHGGHAMAAGQTIAAWAVNDFVEAFDLGCGKFAANDAFEQTILSDGPIPVEQINPSTAAQIESFVWGQNFPPPIFSDEFEVVRSFPLAQKHLKYILRKDDKEFTAIQWNESDPLKGKVQVAYRIENNHYRGDVSVQLMIESIYPSLDLDHCSQSEDQPEPQMQG